MDEGAGMQDCVHQAAGDSSRALRAASRGEAAPSGNSAPTQPETPPLDPSTANWLAGHSFGALHAPSGMADPDYARIFTQARIIAWQYGFALLAHGSFTRDLDLLMVPWEERAYDRVVLAVVNRIAQIAGLTVKDSEPRDKPHGRKAYTLFLPDGVRWVDLSVMPCQQPLQSQGREVPTGHSLTSEAAKPLASSGPDVVTEAADLLEALALTEPLSAAAYQDTLRLAAGLRRMGRQ